MKKNLFIFALVFLIAAPLVAQEYPKAQVFAGYSYLSTDTSGLAGRHGLNGWNGQASWNVNDWFGVTADFGGYYGSISRATTHDYSYLFGPTLTYRTRNFAPYFHALFGGNHIGLSNGGRSGSDSAFAMAIGGGFDVPIKPSIGIRLAQVDWLRTNHGNTDQNNVRVSTGVFFQFGK